MYGPLRSPLGLFGKGFREVSAHLDAMLADLWNNGEQYGCK